MQQLSIRWIVSPSYDLLWFIGACVTGYLFLYLHLVTGVNGLVLWLIWVLSVDSPHFFGTILRTYLDKEERRNRKKTLSIGLKWFLLAPSTIFLGVLVESRAPYHFFLMFAFLYGWWHVFRQHWGFVSLYQKKNNEPSGSANKVDYYFYHIMMIAPFFYFIVLSANVRKVFGLRGFELFATPLLILIIATMTVYIVKEFIRFRQKEEINIPKYLFFLATIPFYLLTYMHPASLKATDILGLAAIITVFHNFQYHGIVHFYAKNRYASVPIQKSKKLYGIAAIIGRNFFTYYLAALAFAWIYRSILFNMRGAGYSFTLDPHWFSRIQFGSQFSMADLVGSIAWGVALQHYYLDQKIWKINKGKQIKRDLNL